jgi:triosephosphate isomerase
MCIIKRKYSIALELSMQVIRCIDERELEKETDDCFHIEKKGRNHFFHLNKHCFSDGSY